MKTKIESLLKESLKAKDSIATSAYREIISGIKLFQTSGKVASIASNNDIVKIIDNALKQHLESKEAFEKANREQSVKDEERYIELLKALLPPELSQEKLLEIVSNVLAEIQPLKQNMGQIIKKVKEIVEAQGFKPDGGKISEIVKAKIT